MTNDIYSNNNYFIEVGKSLAVDIDMECYRIVNLKTKVIEAETSVLAKAIGYAQEFDKSLEEVTRYSVTPKIEFEH